MKVLDLILKAPQLCGVEQYARWSRLGRMLYFHELDEPMSEFAAKDGESFMDRVQVWDWSFYARDIEKAKHVFKLLELVDANHNSKVTQEHQMYVVSYSGQFPDVDQIMTPQEAIESFWAP